ncbi:hypothetical protein CHELA40_50800 [Chelatococcus asaccharovorans]|nr:hypothetical protein CHELA17_20765 [Chelatococcus asaccharovorans]CAH1694337.1 hypothetical protein CHELA40_50800 [Chelatococcus asaccharovorans]
MVLLRHLHPSDTGLGANVGVKRTTSKLMVLVELLNLTFDLELDVRRDSHVKFAPLVLSRRRALFQRRGSTPRSSGFASASGCSTTGTAP